MAGTLCNLYRKLINSNKQWLRIQTQSCLLNFIITLLEKPHTGPIIWSGIACKITKKLKQYLNTGDNLDAKKTPPQKKTKKPL